MSVFRKLILLSAIVTVCFAENYDDQISKSIEGGWQLGAISFLEKLVPAQVYRRYAPSQFQQRCPLCDSSVYSYCGEKLLHDACCCTDPYIHELPHQCRLADCSFLHSNSCREHKLIANCCCSDEYRNLLKSLKI
ncbi:uncharacterized protein LOC117180794 [Belonocnema kinseyi]|uniref:uncharacterized protein LOC117180794 n=1 Tax=Belonocnema kinseyi TaxID=2817044 RepID=UPI00143D1E0A|nr:uncharacterized protein LOC117180794 [Belonocnema kinseyi]